MSSRSKFLRAFASSRETIKEEANPLWCRNCGFQSLEKNLTRRREAAKKKKEGCNEFQIKIPSRLRVFA